MSLELQYRKLWLVIGWLIVIAINVGSLYPYVPERIMSGGLDKVWHSGSYALLMLWFCMLYDGVRRRILIGIGWALMGLMIEVLQGFSIIRTFDLLDFAADVIGISIGGVLMLTPLSRMLLWLESKMRVR
ncbi:MAG: hypothetical protein D6698_03745 [Gammaproteobacteria bacterium]|nr:MAG: hypothetical protein D6698_03745 [Gammaproteobacteria bacterium]